MDLNHRVFAPTQLRHKKKRSSRAKRGTCFSFPSQLPHSEPVPRRVVLAVVAPCLQAGILGFSALIRPAFRSCPCTLNRKLTTTTKHPSLKI